MQLNQMHHVAIIVSDYETSKKFYTELLGFPIIRENYRPERGDWKLDLKFGDSELEIFSNSTAPERPSFPEARGLRHLAFRVDDIESVVAELATMGIPCEPIRLDEYTLKKMTFFRDPDGLPLELHE
jgi:glyoxylase I family protein